MVEIEKGMTEVLASILGLTIDVDIFRGGIPDDKLGGGVMLEYDVSENEPQVLQYTVNFVYKSADRDEVLGVVGKLSRTLPAFGLVGNGKVFMEIIKNGGGGVFKHIDDGVIHYYYSLDLIIEVKVD